MLPVVQGLALVGLAGLEQQGIALRADGQRLCTGHRVQMQRAATQLPHRHQHPPVDAAQLIVAARAALGVVLEESVAVDHQHPRARAEVPGPHGGGIRQPRRARAHPGHGNAEGTLRHLGRRVLGLGSTRKGEQETEGG